ncbi:MAG: hypothetical protein ACFFG0_19095 [Candidatus Thorarchaeota archaeon]
MVAGYLKIPDVMNMVDLLEEFGTLALISGLKTSAFCKHFDGKVLHVQADLKDNLDSEWEIAYNGFEFLCSSSPLKITQLKFDTWMKALDGISRAIVSEEILDSWQNKTEGIFTVHGDKLRENLRRELNDST